MRPKVTLVAVGADGATAVGARIGAFARGLARQGWDVTIIDPLVPPAYLMDRLLTPIPTVLRSMLESAGIEGDIRPATGWRACPALRDVATGMTVVSVPPFALLAATTVALHPRVPLVVDYRDPWSARHEPPLLAQATRAIERRALRRAAAVTYAGGPALGDLLAQRLRLPPHRVISVPNGFDPADIEGLHAVPVRAERKGQPLDLVMNGYWYGRNGPGILLDALKQVGPAVAELTIIGGASRPIAAQLQRTTGRLLAAHSTGSRRELYERLQEADAAIVTMDPASAVESRIPTKVYDYLATGVPVIAICPPGAALLQIPEAQRFHHVHHRDIDGLATLLRNTMQDRTALRPGRLGAGPTREHGVRTLHILLHRLVQQHNESVGLVGRGVAQAAHQASRAAPRFRSPSGTGCGQVNGTSSTGQAP
ncbi:MAG: glycosyltransferase [Actinomycetota bacterium]|nr:glycosyltransferase [Actinomycetota bacterium]